VTLTLHAGSVYERPEYLQASAAHEGSELTFAQAGGLTLPLLRHVDGSVRTVYGLPRPAGDEGSLEALADHLMESGTRLTAVLSPLGSGPRLATLLGSRGAQAAGERPICIAQLAGGDLQDRFHSRTRRAMRTALRRGARTEVGSIQPWFGAFYRAAMSELAAPPIYFFADEYFEALAGATHYQVTVHDELGIAAAALFLHDGDESYYHLGGRRGGAPVVGAMNLALAEGLRHAADLGCTVGVLGGGRTDAPDDSLLAFKRQLAPVLRPRYSVQIGEDRVSPRIARAQAPARDLTNSATRSELDFGPRETIRYQRPELPPIDDIARYYALSEEARFYSNGGPCHERLSSRLAEYVGDVSVIPVGNCTLGLMAALREVCGSPDGRRNLIAVPSFTFTATACAIRWAGFEPLFVDIEPDSWQLRPDALRGALEQYDGRVAGVMGCSTFGTAPPAAVRDGWHQLCDDHGVPLLIDSAAGFGAVDEHGGRLGSQGDTEVFSFHATKPFAIGEGGAIVTPDPDLADRLRRVINFGIDPMSRASMTAGLNAKLSELHCAAGLAMLDRFDDALRRRQATAAALRELLATHPLTYQRGSEDSTWQVFQLLVADNEIRERTLTLASAHNIEVRTAFDPPLHRHPAFADAPAAGALEVTEHVAGRMVSLPMANTLGPRQTTRLAGLMNAAFAR
jgi:dTDP-4-amino-4,6-dideoxygalactose transaminase